MTIQEAGLTGSPKQRNIQTIAAAVILSIGLLWAAQAVHAETTPQKVVSKPTVVVPEPAKPAKATTRAMNAAEMNSLKTVQVRALRAEIALNKAVQGQEAVSKEAGGLIAKVLIACGYDPSKYTISEDTNGDLTIVEIKATK